MTRSRRSAGSTARARAWSRRAGSSYCSTEPGPELHRCSSVGARRARTGGMFHVKHVVPGHRPSAADTPTARRRDGRSSGPRLDLAQRYAELLADVGVERGLLGPHEIDRLWERHLLNCGAVAELVRAGRASRRHRQRRRAARAAPGDREAGTRVVLIESLLRRTEFLRMAVSRTRAGCRGGAGTRGGPGSPAERRRLRRRRVAGGGPAGQGGPVEYRLCCGRAAGCWRSRGSARPDEVREHRRVMTSLGAADARVVECGVNYLSPPTTVVVARRGKAGTGPRVRAAPTVEQGEPMSAPHDPFGSDDGAPPQAPCFT